MPRSNEKAKKKKVTAEHEMEMPGMRRQFNRYGCACGSLQMVWASYLRTGTSQWPIIYHIICHWCYIQGGTDRPPIKEKNESVDTFKTFSGMEDLKLEEKIVSRE